MQDSEREREQYRRSLEQSEHALTEARLSSIDSLLSRLRVQPDDAASESVGHVGEQDGRASADHWLAAETAASRTSKVSGDGSGQDDVRKSASGCDLQLDSAQVRIRVLAHANKDMLVRHSVLRAVKNWLISAGCYREK